MPEKIKKEKLLAEQELVDFLTGRKKYLDGLVITGGEPTGQKDLLSFCLKMKKIGYNIKLDTNGLKPEIIIGLLDNKAVDYIAMDIKGPLDQYEKFCGVGVETDKIKKSIKIIKTSGLPYEFRSTLVKGLHRKSDIGLMAKTIKGATNYFLQNFNNQTEPLKKDLAGNSFSLKELEEFRYLASKYVINVQIR